MRVSKAINVFCSLLVLSSVVAVLFVAGCGFRISASDFPVLKLSNEPTSSQPEERR